MKKTTFILSFKFILMSGLLSAQNFPNPYCNITAEDVEDVEEITQVSLNNVLIENSNVTDALIDKTANIIELIAGNTYTITLKGNTYGNYDNQFNMYIDWDKNGVLNDSGENYVIGTIFNSTGSDTKSASFEFTVPQNTAVGETRVRILKGFFYIDEEDEMWNTPLIDNPCAIKVFDNLWQEESLNFGQALDFTINIVSSTSVKPLDLANLRIYPNPVKEILNIDYKEDISKLTVYDLSGRLIKTYNKNQSNNSIDVSELKSGTYLLNIETQSKNVSTVKFIKN